MFSLGFLTSFFLSAFEHYLDGLWHHGFRSVIGLADLERCDVEDMHLPPVVIRQLRNIGATAKENMPAVESTSSEGQTQIREALRPLGTAK